MPFSKAQAFAMRFLQALEACANGGATSVIPDLKRRSPKEGDLFRGRDPLALSGDLAACGAPVFSVVTEEERFGGSMRLLADVAVSTPLPVLRKDFIRTVAAVEATAAAGAAAVLLIVSLLESEKLLGELLAACAACGLDALVETHTMRDMEMCNRFQPHLVGINNRDIRRGELDDGTVRTTERMKGRLRGDSFVVSESGIETRDDVCRALRAGCDAVLVGTAILRAPDPCAKYRELCGAAAA